MRALGGTQFNGQNVLASTDNAVFQIGANNSTDIDQLTVAAFDWKTSASATSITAVLGATVISGTDLPTQQITDIGTSQAAIAAIDNAISQVNGQRATYGAVQNRFENVVANLAVATENQSAARSRITDADYATETANLSRANILQQAGNAMVAQANQLPQQVLALLR